MTQYAFLIDLSRCIGCQACVIACKQWHNISPGPVKWLRVFQWEKGVFPDLDLRILPIMCFHCENPLCARACPNKAIYKEERYGAVLVNPEKCHGERKCWEACPYGAPQFDSDKSSARMSKCTMCTNRLEKGLTPICVLSCPLRALEFGPLNELREKYGRLSQLPEMSEYSITRPSVIFKLAEPKRQIVPWDYKKALELWRKRHPDNSQSLPDIFSDIDDAIQSSEDITGRNKLVLKSRISQESTFRTMDDE